MSTGSRTSVAGERPHTPAFVEFVSRRRAILRSLATAVLLLVSSAMPLASQASRADLPPVLHPRIFSINPLLLVFGGVVSADYEQRLTSSSTLGASFATYNLTGADYLTIEARGRYYVSGRALDGLSVGALAGLVRMRDEDDSSLRDYAMNVGFTVEQQWLLGVEERVAISAGAGAARTFFHEDRAPFRRILPVLRLSAGWGF